MAPWRLGVAAAIAACIGTGAAGFAMGRMADSATSAVDPQVPPWTDALAAARSSPEGGDVRAAALKLLDESDDPIALAEGIEMLGFVGQGADVALLESFARSHDLLATPAIEALGRLGTDDAVQTLIALVNDRSPSASAAVEALGRSRHPDALDLLARKLRDPLLAPSAAAGLGKYGNEAAVALLAACLDRGEEPAASVAAQSLSALAQTLPVAENHLRAVVTGPYGRRRSIVLGALSAAHDPWVLDALFADLRVGGAVALAAATNLGELDDPRAVAPLRRAALEGNSDLRWTALSSLARIDDPSATDALIDLAEHAAPNLAMSAARAIDDFDDPRVLARVLELADTAPRDVAVGIANNVLLYPWPPGEAPPEVLALARSLLQSGRPYDGVDPVIVLLQQGTPEDVALIEQMFDERWPMRANAVWSLDRVGSPEAIRLLRRLATDSDPSTSQPALAALLQRGETELVQEALLARMRSGGLDYGTTEGMLVSIGTPEAVNAVLDKVRTGTNRERSSAVQAIAGQGSRELVSKLMDIAEDADKELATQILGALVYSDASDMEAVIRRAREIGGPELSGTATEALARLGTSAARDELLELASDADPQTRRSALEALTRIGGPEAEVALVDSLNDPETAWSSLGGLQTLGSQHAVDALTDAAKGKYGRDVRLSALNQAMYLDGIDRDALIDDALRDSDATVRTSAISALANLGSTDAADRLGKVVTDANAPQEERMQAAMALRSVGGPVVERLKGQIAELAPAGDTGAR